MRLYFIFIKMNMKKFIVLLYILFWVHSTFWYVLSDEDNNKLIEAKSKLWLLKYEKNINWYYNQKDVFEAQLSQTQDEKEQFILQELENETLYIIDSYKPENFDQIQYTPEIESNPSGEINNKKNFFDSYGKNIIEKRNLRVWCTKYFDFVDGIAKKNNFPTELIIAVWAKESNCWLFNPYNGWWPFQITSQYHTPWEITLEEMWEKIQAFIDFSKWKIAYYNSNKTYKRKFWEENIDFSYDNYTLKDLQLYAVLYNGIGKTTDYQTSKFANWNLNNSLSSDTDGIVTLFLKILKWELENNK